MVLQIMKMYMQLPIHESGKISHALSEGAVFQPGDLLATLELPEGVVVQKAIPFAGQFPTRTDSKRCQQSVLNPLRTLRNAQTRLMDVLKGYSPHPSDLETLLSQFADSLVSRSLPALEFDETLSILRKLRG